jgi:hypothetical protein
MKKGYILAILFFGSLWGLSEVILGGLLYRLDIPYSSVYLTVIGFGILTVAKVYLPGRGISTAIAAFAMLYKFLNEPFFACHLLGILLLGICYDLFFNVLTLKNRSICAATAIYVNYTLFALMMVYVFRYKHWVEAGFPKVLNHIGIGGTLAALGCALVVPLSHRFGQWLQSADKTRTWLSGPLVAHARLALVTAGMWLFALVAFVVQYHHNPV